MKQRNKKAKKPSRRRTLQQILQLLKDFDQQSLSTSHFCKLHHIHPSNFYHWKKRYGGKQAPRSAPKGFLALELTASAAPAGVHTPALFAEVNGIRLYQPVSPQYLKTLLS
jgi:hypothetical protein